jgi:hypothetical protein
MNGIWRKDHAIHPRLCDTEPLNPFGYRLGHRVELARSRDAAQAAFGHTAQQGLSTSGRQRRILMGVHSDLRGTLKLRNLSFLGSGRMDNFLRDHI